jgi:hypothetical protein
MGKCNTAAKALARHRLNFRNPLEHPASAGWQPRLSLRPPLSNLPAAQKPHATRNPLRPCVFVRAQENRPYLGNSPKQSGCNQLGTKNKNG